MILLDYYQNAIIALVYGQNRQFDIDTTRSAVLSVISRYNGKFRREYGNLVIACDSKNNWRKDIFPLYKTTRAKNKADSQVDWNSFYESIRAVRDELNEYMPYPVIWAERAEADDIIAVLSKENFQNGEKTLIISSDKDFAQLHNQLTFQFDPLKHAYVKHHVSPDRLKEHIIRGDATDGIPNILSNDDAIANPTLRQKTLRQAKFQELMELDLNESVHKRNYLRNKALIDLNEIPENIRVSILQQYYEKKTKRVNPFKYVSQKGGRLHLDKLDHF